LVSFIHIILDSFLTNITANKSCKLNIYHSYTQIKNPQYGHTMPSGDLVFGHKYDLNISDLAK